MSLTPDSSNQFLTSSWAGDHSLFFARAWAERLTTQIEAAKTASHRLQEIDRQIEYMEDWSSSESDYESAFRALWVECVLTVWIADGLHRWLGRLAKEIGEDPPTPIPLLRDLRNALMHLDEASLDEEGPYADPQGTGIKGKSLRELPKARLLIRTWSPGSRLFDLIDVDQLDTMARKLLDQLEAELDAMAEDNAVQHAIDWDRGK